MSKDFKYYYVRRFYMRTLIYMYESGVNICPIVEIKKRMDELEEKHLIVVKFLQITLLNLRGGCNNLFKIGA